MFAYVHLLCQYTIHVHRLYVKVDGWDYSHGGQVGQFTIFAPIVNHMLCKTWHWRGGICWAFLHWQPKHPHTVGEMEPLISVYPG